MRNDISSLASATVDTESVASSNMDISFVNVPSNVDSIGDVPALQVTTSPKHDVIGLASDLEKTQVCVNMKARDLPDDDGGDDGRAPVDIILALDVSGSMSGPKLDLCKKTLELLLRVLYSEDRFGLICYSDCATIDIPAQKMTKANKASCAVKIQALDTRGCTNMSAAVGLALQEMRQIQDPNAVQTIFFLTDGHANAGISDADSLVEFTRNCFQGSSDTMYLQGTEGAEDSPSGRSWNRFLRRSMSRKQQHKSSQEGAKPPAKVSPEKVKCGPSPIPSNPITMHCFGFGVDHDSNLLRAMSNTVPGGSYYFVENDNNVGSAFGDALGGILSVVAQNVVVTIRVPEEAAAKGVEIIDVYHDHKIKREDGSYTVVVGDFYSEESRDVLFEVKLAKSDGGSDPIPHANISVAYTDTLKKAPADANATSCLISRPKGTETSACNPHVNVQWTRVMATRAMSQADAMARTNDLAGARTLISCTQDQVRAAYRATPASYNASSLDGLDTDMTELMSGTVSASMYRSRGAHTFQSSMATHSRQRCMQSAPAPSASYSNKKKSSIRAKFML